MLQLDIYVLANQEVIVEMGEKTAERQSRYPCQVQRKQLKLLRRQAGTQAPKDDHINEDVLVLILQSTVSQATSRFLKIDFWWFCSHQGMGILNFSLQIGEELGVGGYKRIKLELGIENRVIIQIIKMGICASTSKDEIQQKRQFMLVRLKSRQQQSLKYKNSLNEQKHRQLFYQYFDRYDQNHDEVLEREELRAFFRDVLKKYYYTAQQAQKVAQKFIKSMGAERQGKITKDQLYLFYSSH